MHSLDTLFLDRDGVINVDKEYVHKIEDVEFVDGIFELIDTVSDLLPEMVELDIESKEIRIAVIGKPNVGKSSLINKLLKIFFSHVGQRFHRSYLIFHYSPFLIKDYKVSMLHQHLQQHI